MTEIRKLYQEAFKNEVFNQEYRQRDPIHYKKPSWYSDELFKDFYAMVYFGWLIANDQYR